MRTLLSSKVLTVGFLLFFISFKAHSQGFSCSDLFDQHSEKYITFDKVGETTGAHGGRLSILRKHPGESWESRLRVDEDLTPNFQSNIAQGDPGFMIALLGESKAKFWGFKFIDHNTVTLPNAKELQGAVKAFNSRISSEDQRIQVGFYEVAGEAPTETYTKNYLKSKLLPIGKSGIISVHDRSVHTIHAFNDPRIDRFMTASIQSKLKALEVIKEELPEVAKRQKISVDMIYKNETNRIDILSAVMNDIFTAYISDLIIKGKEDNSYNFFEFSKSRMFREILDDGRTPRESVESFFNYFKQQYDPKDPEYAALEKLKKKFDIYALKNIPDYQYKPGITKKNLFETLLARYQFILENTPD